MFEPETSGSAVKCLLVNNGVFTGVFSCWHVACEDAGRVVYSELRLHVTGKYNPQQAGISC